MCDVQGVIVGRLKVRDATGPRHRNWMRMTGSLGETSLPLVVPRAFGEGYLPHMALCG